MTGLELSSALRAGRRVFGTLIVSDSPRWPETVATTGLDFVFIDTEHMAIDRSKLSWMCQLYRTLGLPPVVRIPSPDPDQACMVLDGGACGVIAPYVETVAQVEALVGAVKLRPIKGRRAANFARRTEQPEPELARYLTAGNANHVLVINVESQPALDILDQLVAVPGLDAVLIGPHDLSCSLGVPEQYDHPKFEAAVLKIFATARKHGVGAGLHSWMGLDREVSWASRPDGANMIIHEGDIIAMRLKLSADIALLRLRLGDAPSPGKQSADNI
jgi:2-keto-3-deoxy-L-rhamnonate aldolase RhmA